MASRPYNAREINIKLRAELASDFGATAFAILRNLVAGSPVGNPSLWQNPGSAPAGYVGGHFRRNWIVSIGGVNPTELEGTDATGASTIATGKAQIDRFTKARRLGPNLVIQNNVPYAERLAQGHSSQAGAGWVDDQIDAALSIPGGTTVLR